MFNTFFSSARLIGFFVSVLLLSAPVLAQNTGSNDDLKKSFKRFDLFRTGGQQALRRVQETGALRLRANGRDLVLFVEPNDLRSRSFRTEDVGFYGVRSLESAQVNTYRGQVENEAGSQVRLTLDGEKIEGYFVSRGETYYVEPAIRYSSKAHADQLVIYKEEDFLGDDGFSCPSEMALKIENGKGFVDRQSLSGLEGPGTIELATEADFEYVNDLGGAAQANSEIMSILNMVEGTFDSELDLTILVTLQHTWSVQDPFDGSSPNSLLISFQNHWNSDPALAGVHRDAAHLFSSKPAVLSMGFAYIGVICSSPAAAYGFSGRVNWAPGKFLVTAHEIGHNLNAAHAEAAQGCANTLMNSQLSGVTALSFCPFSREQINTFNTANGSCLAPPQNASAAAFDFDGDSKTDISIYRPGLGQWWYLRSSDQSPRVYAFGNASDKTVSADFTGDGITDVAFWRPATGEWYILRSEDSSFFSVPFGTTGDIPAPGDFDGDGKADFAVFRPSTHTWYISASSAGTTIQQFGANGDIPVVSDYDGDGKSDIGIFRPGVSEWWISKSAGGILAVQFGAPGDKPVQADYTGDGKSDVAVWRPSIGTWLVLRSEDSSYYSAMFGMNGDIPVPGDYDGDGTADHAIWRPLDMTWYLLRSQAGFGAMTFGSTGDQPVPASFVP